MRKFGKLFVILCVSIVVLECVFLFTSGESKVAIDKKVYIVKLPVLVKFVALVEREYYYKAWLNNIIAPGINDPKEKIKKVFEYVQNLKSQDVITQLGMPNVEQHDYYALIKQYGTPSEKSRVFCNLMVVAGYQASETIEWSGLVIVKAPGEFLYFDFKKAGGPLNKQEISERINKKDKELCESELGKRYLWGDLNIPMRAFTFYLRKNILRQKLERAEFLIQHK